MKLEKLAHFQSELTFLVKWSPDGESRVREHGCWNCRGQKQTLTHAPKLKSFQGSETVATLGDGISEGNWIYSQTSNINCTLGNKIVDHTDVVGASPVGTAPTTSSFSI